MAINESMSNKSKKRLDMILVEKGLAETRSKAIDAIKLGRVKIDNHFVTKAGKLVSFYSLISVEPKAFLYVSRGGEKLAYALKTFDINVKNKVCLDVGASVGGFTDCLLKHGAKLVYAVDVGKNQLHPLLKNNKRVISFENTDIRKFSLPDGKLVDFICVDVSFISLNYILPVIKKFLSLRGKAVILIKPQFEVGRKNLNKSGIVKNQEAVQKAIENILEISKDLGFVQQQVVASPITGKKGNQEYLLYIKNSGSGN